MEKPPRQEDCKDLELPCVSSNQSFMCTTAALDRPLDGSSATCPFAFAILSEVRRRYSPPHLIGSLSHLVTATEDFL